MWIIANISNFFQRIFNWFINNKYSKLGWVEIFREISTEINNQFPEIFPRWNVLRISMNLVHLIGNENLVQLISIKNLDSELKNVEIMLLNRLDSHKINR